MLGIQGGTGARCGSASTISTQAGAATNTLPLTRGGTKRGRALNGKIYDRQCFMIAQPGEESDNGKLITQPSIFQRQPNFHSNALLTI